MIPFRPDDLLADLVDEHGAGVSYHDLLIAVLEQLLLPRLDHHVEASTLVSLHNPVRARTID
ncbi:MAG: hypothetical protein ABIJ48_05815 [Actinomycetota bacterium]